MRYSPEGLPRQAFLTERTAAMNFQSNAEVFIPTDKGIVVIDTFSDTLWRYNTGALKPYLVFDFGDYAIDGDFFTIEDMRESARLLFASQFAMVNRYMENGDARLVEFSVQTADRKRSWLYGYDDGNGWRWIQTGAPFEGSFRLLNGRQVVCLLEPSQLARISDAVRSKIENPEVLDEIAPDDNYVLARISFTK